MDQQKKLYIAVAVLALLGGLLFVQRRSEHKELAEHSLEGQAANLPKIELTEEATKTIDRVVIVKPPAAEGGQPEEVVLAKTGEDAWSLKKPNEAKANASNVKSLLENLKTLKVSELIDASTTGYAKYQLSDDKGLHAALNRDKWPTSLEEITSVPVPDDPLTHKPFHYKIKENRAILSSILRPGEEADSQDMVTYEMTLRQE